MLNNTYAYVRARWVILIWITSEVFVELLGRALWPDWRTSDLKPDTLRREVFRMTSYGFTCFLLWFIWGHNLSLKKIFGTLPNHREAWIYLSLSIPTLGLHYVGTYLLYLPLSYVVPAFVAWRLPRVKSPAYIGTDWVNLISANHLKDFGTVVVAPIVEEIIFRGYILHRWCLKYGEKRAVVQSSILFGILHTEILGKIVSSVIKSVLCLRTKSLVGPIFMHMSYNLLVVLAVEFVLQYVVGIKGIWVWVASTVEEFQSGWWLGVIGGVISVPWLYWFVKTRLLESNVSP